jgi:hypothetical protein
MEVYSEMVGVYPLKPAEFKMKKNIADFLD